MPAFVEFALIAIALFLWESTLWLPLRSIALRRRWSGNRWRTLDPRNLMATRELGLVPMLPLPPDAGLAPCQAPPLMVDGNGNFVVETTPEQFSFLNPLTWNDLKEDSHHFSIAGTRVRISSHRCIDVLRRAKRRDASPEAAVRQAWSMALSSTRAGREWRRWKLVSGTLRWNGLLLTLGFFVGLPLAYVYRGGLTTVALAFWLWCVMAWTAAHLWWLGRRVYPDARAALRMDALLALLVPFHAMRAMEIAAVHAMGTTHPVGLMLWSGDFENAWLGRFARRVLHPMRTVKTDLAFSSALRIPLIRALAVCGKRLEDFDVEPSRAGDEQASRYCPRCHGLFLAQFATCSDCRGLALRSFADPQ